MKIEVEKQANGYLQLVPRADGRFESDDPVSLAKLVVYVREKAPERAKDVIYTPNTVVAGVPVHYSLFKKVVKGVSKKTGKPFAFPRYSILEKCGGGSTSADRRL